MGITQDLTAEVMKILQEKWTVREGRKVPEDSDLKLGNDALKLNGAVLYADLAESTKLVTGFDAPFVAQIYKCYLNCACRLIRQKGGEITAFDGDRVMAVFVGPSKETDAARTALAINHMVTQILNPSIKQVYPNLPSDFQVRQAVGIDTSELFVAKTGIRGSNDLVWVGRAANIAAKLCALREGYASWITADVYRAMNDSVRTSQDGKAMWEQQSRSIQSSMTVYRSNWSWGL